MDGAVSNLLGTDKAIMLWVSYDDFIKYNKKRHELAELDPSMSFKGGLPKLAILAFLKEPVKTVNFLRGVANG